MLLRRSIAVPIENAIGKGASGSGAAVVSVDSNKVARFERLAIDGTEPEARECLLQFRKRGECLRLGGEADFFEEGQADLFANARFGELRLGAGGEAILVGLRDREFNRRGAIVD